MVKTPWVSGEDFPKTNPSTTAMVPLVTPEIAQPNLQGATAEIQWFSHRSFFFPVRWGDVLKYQKNIINK